MATVDADLEWQWRFGVDDRPSSTKHATLVVLARERNARAAEQLAAVRVDVDVKQRDVLGLEGGLCDPQRLVQRLRQAVGAVGLEALSVPLNLKNAHRGDAVHWVGRTRVRVPTR